MRIKLNSIILNITKFLPDKLYLQLIYFKNMNKLINFKNPKGFNEKLQWLKLYDRNSKYVKMVDKIDAKEYISEILGNEYIIPTIGVWNDANEIKYEDLPNQFVIKCNHDSKSVFICKDKDTFDFDKVKTILNKRLKNNGYWYGREWPYKNVHARIIVEKYMEDSTGGLIDYKFFCFNGYVDCVMVCMDRDKGYPKFYYFDSNWNVKKLNKRGIEADKNFSIRKPKCMDEMFRIASNLSKGIPFVRVDLYECQDKIYFGELTFFPASGFDREMLHETDCYFGSLIDLDNVERV